MYRKIVAVWVSLVMLFGFVVIVDVVTDITPPVRAATLYVNTTGLGGAYTSIQDAINLSSDGDTVFVYSGTYYERIIINKTITLIGEDNDTTIINNDRIGDVVNITVDWVNVTGFTIRDSGWDPLDAGIKLYHVNDTSISNNKIIYNRGDGIRLTCSNRTTITSNLIKSNSDYGVYISSYSNSNLISNNNLSNNYMGVRFYYASGENIVSNNTIYSNYYGIYLYQSSDINITDNIIFQNWDHGTYLYRSQNCNISNNIIFQNDDYGLCLSSSSNNNITGNTFTDDGVYLTGSPVSHFTSNNIPTDNTVNGKPLYFYKDTNDLVIDGMILGQLILANCLNFSISNLTINRTDVGIEVAFSSNITMTSNNISCDIIGIAIYHADGNIVTNNNLSNNGRYGLYVYSSSDNTIDGNNLSYNGNYGFYLSQSSNNKISNNIIEYNDGYGIYMTSSNYNNITNNNISYNEDYGIYVSYSRFNKITSNNLTNDGIFLNGDWIPYHNSHEITTDNIVNGKSILYYKNQTSLVLDGLIAGQLIIVNCTYFTVMNMAINSTDVAVQIAFSDNITLTNNNLSNCDWGIYSFRSSNLTISDNIFDSNRLGGIYISRSSQNIITNNNVSFNYYGIHIISSEYDFVAYNNVSHNNEGIRLDYSTNSTITSNNCSDNVYALHLYRSKYNNITGNQLVSNDVYGIYLRYSTRNNITGNKISPDNLDGIHMWSCDDNLIIGNDISTNRRYGIRIWGSSRNFIEHNTISLNWENGLYISSSSNDNYIIGNDISENNRHGVELSQSSNGNQFWENNITSNHIYGFYISSSNNNNITKNNVSLNWNYGMYLSSSPDNDIIINSIKDNLQGIFLSFSSDNVVTNNIFSTNDIGIRLYESDGNTINGNELNNHIVGIELDNSDINILENNTLSFNDRGIVLVYNSDNNSLISNIMDQNSISGIWISSSNDNTLTDNTITKSIYGIYIYSSLRIILNGNTMDSCGIFIQGPYLEHWNTHTLDTSNTVNGKPVRYWKNINGGTIPFNAGQVLLANCSNVKVEYQELQNGTVGIELGFSYGNNITGIISQNNQIGIFLYSSDWNDITYNLFFANDGVGIHLENSSKNRIYHNNIVDNLIQAYDNRSDNNWDSGYPDGGNYWSDYTGVDLYSTPNQDVPPPDGLGDTPYVIDSNSRDNYPLKLSVDLPEFDFTPPVITSVLVTGITPVSATITWWTDEPADSLLNFSENPDLSFNTSIFQSIQTTFHSITLTLLSPNQTYYFEILSGDDHGNYAKDDNTTQYYHFTTLPPDLTPPIISQVTVNNTTENSTTISWLTDEASDSRVNWSVNSDLSNNSTCFSSIYTTSHSMTITNLLPNQTYYFEVTSVDIYENVATDNNGLLFYTFKTLEKDTNPPVITDISVVPPAQEVHNAIKITTSVTDDRNIGGVWVNITDANGELLGNLSMSYDPVNDNYYLYIVPDQVGTYSFVIWAVDSSNNFKSSIPTQFQVQDTTIPTITHSANPSSQEMEGEINITASVSDNYDIAGVWVQVTLPDNSELENVTMFKITSTDDYWYITSFTLPGNYTYGIWAKDVSGNWGFAYGKFTVIDSEPPVANAGTDLEIEAGQMVVLNGSASTDNHGIEKYTWSFEYNGETITLYGEKTSFLFNISGNYSVTLKVTDHSGNWASDTLWVHILPEDIEDDDIEPEKKPFFETFWWLIVILIIIILLALLVFLSKRRGETSNEIDEAEDNTKTLAHEEEQKPHHQPPPPPKDTQNLPPPPPSKDELPPPPPPRNLQ